MDLAVFCANSDLCFDCVRRHSCVFGSDNGMLIIFTFFPQSLWLCFFFPAPYIKPCARSDPNFNECALERAKDVFPQMVKGSVSFYSTFMSRSSRLNAKSLFIWENIKTCIASQVPDFEGSKNCTVWTTRSLWSAGLVFLKSVVCEEPIYIPKGGTYIHKEVTELKEFVSKELQTKVKIWISQVGRIHHNVITQLRCQVTRNSIVAILFFFYCNAFAKTFDVKLWNSNNVSSNT
jgi:hypothetical protein